MENKTAMQQMHDWLVDKWSDPGKLISCLEVMNKIEDLLQKERQQIIDAHLTGLIHPLEIEATKQAEQYYNETYNNTNS